MAGLPSLAIVLLREIDGFLAELGAALDVELRRTERGRDALREWLNSTA